MLSNEGKLLLPSTHIILLFQINQIFWQKTFTITILSIRLIEIGLDIVLSLSSVQYLPIAP